MARRPNISWKARKVRERFEGEIEKRMTLAAAYVEGRVKRRISRLNPPPHLNPSEPGQPPKVVTGNLRSNVIHKVLKSKGRITGLVGVRKSVPYARRLELGFTGVDSLGRNVNQAPRPYLVPTAIEERRAIARFLKGGR